MASRAIFPNFFEERWTQNTHNTFRDCRVHFLRQPFSKQLYTELYRLVIFLSPSALRIIYTSAKQINVLVIINLKID